MALAGLCLAAKVVKTEDRQRADVAILWNQTTSQLDLLGAALLFSGLVLLLAALTLGIERSWDDWLVIMLFAVGVVLLMAFIVQEYRFKGLPILPLDMMSGYERVGLLISNISLGITAYGVSVIPSLAPQHLCQDKPTKAFS